MKPEELEEYQENEIDGALENVQDRLEHLSGRVSDGILSGEKLQEHQNARAEAYLEGYADALQYASREINGIQNMGGYLPEELLNAENGGNGDA